MTSTYDAERQRRSRARRRIEDGDPEIPTGRLVEAS